MCALPYKHLPPHSDRPKSEVLGLEIARLEIPSGYSIPVVATTLVDRINLFWWTGEWKSREREHSRFDKLTYSTNSIVGRVFDPLMQAPWSHRVGLAAGNGYVFLVYKRRIHIASGYLKTGLFIEGFLWDENAPGKLKPLSEFPVQIPLEDMGIGQAGYYLWAGFSEPTNQLLILTQTVPDGSPSAPYLTLLSTSSYAQLQDLRQLGTWNTKRIDVGGFDFDAYLQDTSLHILYRRTGHALQIPVSFPELGGWNIYYNTTESPLPSADVNAYEPLTFRTLTLPEADTQVIVEGIPGGEHPQIQRIDPLLITADRVEAGSIRIDKWLLPPIFNVKESIFVKPMVSRSRKVLLRKVDNEWRTSLLMTIRDDMELRNQSYRVNLGGEYVYNSQFDELISIPDMTTNVLHWMKPYGQLPVHMTRYGRVPREKAIEIDLLHHDASYDGLIVSRWRFSENEAVSEANGDYFVSFDINHDQIPPSGSLVPPGIDENSQFSPFEVRSAAAYTRPDLNLILEGKTVDNTMGGSLVAERGDGVKFAAYTDLGDGGARVIFDDSLPVPDPKYPTGQKEEMDPASVEGPRSSSDEWIDLLQTGDWENYTMTPFRNWLGSGSMVSGLDGAIDTLFLLKGDPSELELTPASTQQFQDDPLLSLTGNGKPIASGKPLPPVAAKLSSHQLNFSYTQGPSEPAEQCVDVKHIEGGSLPYPTVMIYYREQAGNWLSAYVSPADGYYKVCLKPTAAGLAPGRYEAAVIINAGTSQLLVVSLDVKTVGPSVVLSTPLLNLSGQRNSPGPYVGTVEVRNGGGGSLGTLTASITYVPGATNWLRATVTDNLIRVEANASGLASGIYSATVNVSASGSSASFLTQFFVSVSPSFMTQNPSELLFQQRYRAEGPNGDPSAMTIYMRTNYLPAPRVDNIEYLPTPDLPTPGDWLNAVVVKTFTVGFWLWVQPDMSSLSPGSHSATITMSDPSGIVSPWGVPVTFTVEPPDSYAAFAYPAFIFAGAEIDLDATPTYFWNYEGEELTYLWKVERLDEHENVIDTQALGPFNNPVAHFTFAISAAYRVTLTVTAPDGLSREISARVTVEPSPWDSVWGFHEQFETDEFYAIGDCSLSFSKYEFRYEVSGDSKSVKIRRKDKYAAAYRFRGAVQGQGHVDLRLPISFSSNDVDFKGRLGEALSKFFSVDRVNVDLSYGRPFTPGVLTVDRRESSGDTLKKVSAGLAAKPIGNSFHDVDSVKVKGGLKFLGHLVLDVIPAIVTVLAWWGFATLAREIGALELGRAIALALGQLGLAAGLTAALIAIVETQVPPAIRKYIERKIRDQLDGPGSTFKQDALDTSGLLTYAGEGLAEEIATRVLRQEGIRGESSQNRSRPDFWQQIFVGEKLAKLLIRK